MICAPFCRLVCIFSLFSLGALAQTGISLNPQQVSLAAPAGSTAQVTQTIYVITTGQNAEFNASVQQAGSSIPWLSVSPAEGITPAALTITADASNLPAGTYLGQLAVRARNAGNIGAVANVTFTVGGSTGGGLLPDHSSLTFVSQSAGDGPSSRILSVASAQGSASAVKFDVSASSPGNWLSVSPQSGTTPATLTVTVTRTPILLGEYAGSITLTTQGANPTVIPVTLLARGEVGEAPTITLSAESITVVHQPGTPLASESVGVTITSGSQAYTASTTTSWLRLFSPFNPTPAMALTDYAPGVFSILVDPTGLNAPYTDTGIITVSSPGAQSRTLAVNLRITNSAALNASPSALTFEQTGISLQYVSVTSTSTDISFTVAESPPVPWLSVSPTAAVAGDGDSVWLSLTGNPSGVAPGTYNTSLNLVGQNGSTLLSIPVRLIVPATNVGPPALVTPQSSLDFKGFVGGANLQQTLTVTANDASTTHRFAIEVSSEEGWLTVVPTSGVAPALLTITVNMAAISSPGTYVGSVLITSLLTGEQQMIPVNLEVAAQVVTASPSSLTFAQQEGGGSPAPQSIQVSAVRQAAFVVSTSAGWLTATPDRLVTPGTLTVSVNASGLAPGTYQGNVQLTGTTDRLTIPVSLTVPGPPSPTATPQSVTFTYRLGSPAPASQSITVGSTGRAVTFRAAASTESGVKWLTVSPDTGATPGMLTTSINPALLVPGRHAGSVTITRSDSSTAPVTVPITLNVTTSSVAVGQVLNAASLAPAALAPGEIVTITGSGLGSATGIAATPTAAGAIESRLGNVRVLFDDVPAPLLYVRADQINAIVPYAVYGRLSARVQVVEGENYSIPIEAKVVEAAPALFTTGAMGRGQAAALNADMTVNSLANPALRGGVITLYGTGEGQTDPQGQDGRMILTDLRRPLLLVTATVGGRPATVLYAGSAPTLVSGVFQVNVRIPEDVEPGPATIQVQVGGAATQAGVTIAVR